MYGRITLKTNNGDIVYDKYTLFKNSTTFADYFRENVETEDIELYEYDDNIVRCMIKNMDIQDESTFDNNYLKINCRLNSDMICKMLEFYEKFEFNKHKELFMKYLALYTKMNFKVLDTLSLYKYDKLKFQMRQMSYDEYVKFEFERITAYPMLKILINDNQNNLMNIIKALIERSKSSNKDLITNILHLLLKNDEEMLKNVYLKNRNLMLDTRLVMDYYDNNNRSKVIEIINYLDKKVNFNYPNPTQSTSQDRNTNNPFSSFGTNNFGTNHQNPDVSNIFKFFDDKS